MVSSSASEATPSRRLTFSEFIDLLLTRLYELEQAEGGGVFYDLNEIADELKAEVPSQWVYDAGRVLETQGLARCLFAMGGYSAGMITGEGRLFVEQQRGSGIIREYRSAPENFVVVSGSGNQVTVGTRGNVHQSVSVETERRPAFDLLDEIQRLIESDVSLSDTEKSDLLADVDVVRGQLKKREPNLPAVAAILDPLSRITSLAGSIANLINLLNP